MKNGQLWFNTKTLRVERVVACGPRIVATTYHKDHLTGWLRSQMRPATTSEVKTYLDEVNGKKTVVTTEGRLVYA